MEVENRHSSIFDFAKVMGNVRTDLVSVPEKEENAKPAEKKEKKEPKKRTKKEKKELKTSTI